MQRFAHHGLHQAYSMKRCIEVTIGSEESFVGVLDRPKYIILLQEHNLLLPHVHGV